MASTIQILLTDDIDGSEAVETIPFGVDGVTYEIDLNEKNAIKLRKAMAPFIEAARRTSPQRRRRTRKPAVPAE